MKNIKTIIYVLIAVVLILAANSFDSSEPEEKSTTALIEQPKAVAIKTVENDNIRKHLLKLCDQKLIADLNNKSLIEATIIVHHDIHPELTLEKINDFLNQCYRDLKKIKKEGVLFYQMDEQLALDTIARYLSENAGIIFEKETSQADPYLLSSVFLNKRANYRTLPLLFALVAEKCGFPVSVVNVEGHVFARFENSKQRFNVECAGPRFSGLGGVDEQYISRYKPAAVTIKNGVNMRSLSVPETIGMMFNNKMQYYYWKKKQTEIDRCCAYALLFNDKDYFAIRTIMANLLNSQKTNEKENLYNALVDHLNAMGGRFNKETLSEAEKKKRYRKKIDELARQAREKQKKKEGSKKQSVPQKITPQVPKPLEGSGVN